MKNDPVPWLTYTADDYIGEVIKIQNMDFLKNLRTNGNLLKYVRYGLRNNMYKMLLPP